MLDADGYGYYMLVMKRMVYNSEYGFLRIPLLVGDITCLPLGTCAGFFSPSTLVPGLPQDINGQKLMVGKSLICTGSKRCGYILGSINYQSNVSIQVYEDLNVRLATLVGHGICWHL